MEEVEDSAQAGQQAAQHMGQEPGPADIDAQHIGALAVAAHGVEAAAQPGPAQQAEQQDHHRQRDDDSHLDIGGDILAQLVAGAQAGDNNPGLLHRQEGLVGHADGLLADDGGHALGEEHARQ